MVCKIRGEMCALKLATLYDLVQNYQPDRLHCGEGAGLVTS